MFSKKGKKQVSDNEEDIDDENYSCSEKWLLYCLIKINNHHI